MYTTIRARAENAIEYGQKEDWLKVLTSIRDESIENQRDFIDLLEYLIDDEEPIR